MILGWKEKVIVTTKEQKKPGCPCCGVSQKHGKDTGHDRAGRVVQCKKCEAIYTLEGSSIYLGDSYAIVLPRFTTDTTADTRSIYFDLTVLGSGGVQRRHGWFDPTTKLITQVG